jgi:hypothetical protein
MDERYLRTHGGRECREKGSLEGRVIMGQVGGVDWEKISGYFWRSSGLQVDRMSFMFLRLD